MEDKMKGLFICLEGPDGCGKTTQFNKIYNYLLEQGKDVIISREPGGTLIGEKIREVLLDVKSMNMGYLTEALLYAAARAQNVKEVIKPALENGKIVLCDRYVYSSYVYQGIARGIGIDEIEKLNILATENIYPNITLYYKIDYTTSLERIGNRGNKDRIENETQKFHKTVFNGYEEILNKYKSSFRVVDGEQDEEKVFKDSIEIINDYINY
jgi:dTMP kinase